MPQAVKEIRRSDGAVSLFRYEAGRMVGGYGTDYGSFVIAAAPFSIEVTERTASLSGTSMRQTRYEDCLANPEGFITFMHFERREAHFAAGQWRTLRCHGHLSVSYDPQGRVASMRHAYQDGTGRSGKGRTTYEWEEDGKLSSVVTDLSRMGNLYESHAVSIFRYAATEDAGATANGGLYWEEPDACPFVYDFMWYAGLFGRPLGRMPVEMLHERLGDGGNRKTISTLSVKRDSLGRAVSVCRDGRVETVLTYGDACAAESRSRQDEACPPAPAPRPSPSGGR